MCTCTHQREDTRCLMPVLRVSSCIRHAVLHRIQPFRLFGRLRTRNSRRPVGVPRLLPMPKWYWDNEGCVSEAEGGALGQSCSAILLLYQLLYMLVMMVMMRVSVVMCRISK